MSPRALLALLLLVGGCTTQDTGKSGDSVPAGNSVPTADAGVNGTGSTDSAVSLNGAGSSDPDGDALTWHWSFVVVPDGSALATREAPFSRNHSADAAATSFTPDLAGTYIAGLIVNDGHQDSAMDQVVITVEQGEQIPVANAGVDVAATVGGTVTFDGSGSYDPMGGTLSYAWSLVDKPSTSSAALTDDTTVNPKLTVDKKGSYVVNLVVSNGTTASVADAVTVTATGTDNAPVANAGADNNSAEDCTAIQLDCSSSSDPDGDPLTYSWEVQSKPSGSALSNSSFSDRSAAKPTVYLDVAGSYTLSCAVSDGSTWSSPDLVNITAAERSANSKPVVDAGANQTLAAGSAECTEDGYTYNCDECAEQTITLGADASITDPDSDPLTYSWTLRSGDATAEIASSTSLQTTVTLSDIEPTTPGACEDVSFEFELSVTDCTGATSTDTVTVIASCCGVEDTD